MKGRVRMKRKVICLTFVMLFFFAFSVEPRAVAYNSQGLECYKAGRYEEAIDYFKKAIEIDPKYDEAHSNLGLTYYHLKRYREALGEFETAVSLRPDFPQYHINLAAAYERCNRYWDAAKELETYLYLPVRGIGLSEEKEVKEMIAKLRGMPSSYRQGGYKSFREPKVLGTSTAEELFHFMQISDPHMGEDVDGGTQDSDYLSWIVRVAYPTIKPSFIVDSGDLTDSTNGGLIPVGGPYQSEWDQYRVILFQAGMNAQIYYDCPGNHDHYNDAQLSYYLRNSIQGQATGKTQQAWSLNFGTKSYQFLNICTAGNDGRPWPVDNAGLDPGEIAWIKANINPRADLIFFFGHHPLDDLEYGRSEFQSILKQNPSVYCYGHTHEFGISYYEGRMLVNCASLGKSGHNHYLIISVDQANEISVTPYDVYELPSLVRSPILQIRSFVEA
jgi:tetratricopeptide (TPR) repeat protein